MAGSSASSGPSYKRHMTRLLTDALSVHPSKKSWTTLVQVIERQCTREYQQPKQPKTVYRTYLLTDMKGTKVTAMIYEPNINYFDKTLQPYKRYYVSNAKVRPANPIYKIGSYDYYWTISKATLVEPVDESVPPTLPCAFDFVKFSELRHHADKNSMLAVKALVIAEFPTVEVNDTKTIKDYAIINEEKIPMILRIWNELTDPVELQLPFKGEPLLIVATRMRVTTFDGLSLCTRPTSYFMENPPIHEDIPLLDWYKDNEAEIKTLIAREAYKDTTKLLPYPSDSELVPLSEAVANLESIKTAWVSGKVHMVPAQENICFAACANCNKYLRADIAWEIVCTSCTLLTSVQLRCRMDLFLTDRTTTIQVNISSPEAEKLIPFSEIQLRHAYAENKMPIKDIEASIENKNVVCFLRYYDKKFRGNNIRTYAIVKLYETHAAAQPDSNVDTAVPKDRQHEKYSCALALVDKEIADPASSSVPCTNVASPMVHSAPEKQFFSPTAKTIIDEISSESTVTVPEVSQASGIKRSLKFDPKLLTQPIPPAVHKSATTISIKLEEGLKTDHAKDVLGKRSKDSVEED